MRLNGMVDGSSTQPSVSLRSATNPENGTVSYTYSSDSTLATKTDAKGQVFTYAYDSYKRMTQVSVNGALLRTLSYDTPLDSSFSHYTFGRLTGVTYPNATIGQITEMYNYEIYGAVSGKRVQMNRMRQTKPC
jgi:YD repeat-containing protein